MGSTRSAQPYRARYRRILRFAARAFVQIWWFELILPRLGFAHVADRTRDSRMLALARRFRTLAVDLGGLMIKVGQFMSSRLDVLPPEITAELTGLQDEVPAERFEDIRRAAEAELGMPLERAYASFDPVPVAAASLGQAHRATLTEADAADTGLARVVVKVQRPGIDEIVAVDLDALRRIARWAMRVHVVRSRVDAPALVEEFAQTSLEEIDYLHEAANAERFAENFATDARVVAPAIVWERSTRRVLTLEDVTAIKINDTAALRDAGINPADVATVFAEVMLDQVFTHSFVHADPHPGNIFVTPVAPGSLGPPKWRLTFIDFGMMAEVPDGIRSGLRTLVIAVAARDSRGLVTAAQQIGVLLPSTNTAELERALTVLFARFGGMGFNELKNVDPRELQDFGREFGETIRALPVQLPEKLLLLLRAVSLTSGMCSSLDATFNIWEPVKPYADKLVRDEGGNVLKDLGAQTVSNASILWRLPNRVEATLDRLDAGSITFDISSLEHRLDKIIRVAFRAVSAVLFGGMLIGGVLLLTPVTWLGVTLMCASAVPLLHAVFGKR
ncbi:ABC1 kinase family protein [Paramicrobacterium agarici]|uniref:ABC1 kinase family protein n=1 Tax=Paramicrobacterium agarici TaxID=630514 RepID=UPI0011518240|nr:AarF/UbiB family protein [Microbacterium agarici]TQO22856.1 putative unusual protein kinase regulating ubiquinone biosynthesis (AarF/ABC1/UbiB family) [Microbacterium agarici]